jgi:predicted lipoprotein with Yx(FWY)xxD motif
MRTLSAGRLAAPLVAIALIVGACSAGATASPSAAAPSVAPSASAAASAAASQAASVYTLTVVDNANLGKFLTGEDGKTLYTFAPDSMDTSTCVDTCATNWPAFVLEGGETAVAGTSVTGKIATFKRPDGSMQVSYNGKPLYYFAKDTRAGDTNGQGLASGKWLVAAP